MARRPIRISVSRKARQSLDELLSTGVQPVRVVLRALALLHLADGSSAPATVQALKKLTAKAVRSIRPESVGGEAVSPNFLSMLGVRPFRGREFDASEGTCEVDHSTEG
jgi:hypothetical protein